MNGKRICYICKREIEESEPCWTSYVDKPTCKECFWEKTITYDRKMSTHIATPKDMEDFLNDIDDVCKKHGLSIGHEDRHGGFEIEKYNDENINWLKHASKEY